VTVSAKISDIIKVKRQFLWRLSLTYWHMWGSGEVHKGFSGETWNLGVGGRINVKWTLKKVEARFGMDWI